MVNVINAIGIAVGANTAIDLSPYVEGDIANLVGVRTTVRAGQTTTFTGVSIAAHTHNVEATGSHTHSVEAEAAHQHTVGVSFGAAVSDAGHTHVLTVYAAGAFTPTTQGAGAFTPTTNAFAGVAYSARGAGPIAGAIDTNQVVWNDGWMDATYLTPAAGSVGLTGRRAIMMGDSVVATTMLEIRVMYCRDASGIF